MEFTSKIKLGEKYRDLYTGYEGRAVLIMFNPYNSDSVVELERLDKDNDLSYQGFHSDRLEQIDGKAKKQTYTVDAQLGEKYRDTATGITGTATSVAFHVTACEQLLLDDLDKDGKVRRQSFDVSRLENVETGAQPEYQRAGGPDRRHTTKVH